MENTYTAFEGSKLLVRGPLDKVVLKSKHRLEKSPEASILIFSDSTGRTIDFNFHGSEDDVLKRLEIYVSGEEAKSANGPGRPKLGVVSREVSLLPRHWEWLANQTGGASATLRKLIESEQKKSAGGLSLKQAQERVYKFMSVLAGDLEGYEEALRALYRKDVDSFQTHIKSWPRDVKTHTLTLAASIFDLS
ncbi:MAG: DUF2239 family protein [Bdellovibrionaceae bacterium]|nr:DUF2239 family protein [Pseudobdellovibrionaceae bacterium]